MTGMAVHVNRKMKKRILRFCKRLQCSDGRDGSSYMEMENLAKAQLENFR